MYIYMYMYIYICMYIYAYIYYIISNQEHILVLNSKKAYAVLLEHSLTHNFIIYKDLLKRI